MIKINDNFLNLQDNYLFTEVKNRVNNFKEKNKNANIINLGIGDVTRPLPNVVINAMKKACDEMSNINTFRGYGPEQGYEFLRENIVKYDYMDNGINIEADEVFISDGAKSDLGNLGDILSIDNKVAIQDPVYPVYIDTNVISGRSGKYIKEKNIYENIIYLDCNEKNKFVPKLPEKIPDIIYLCYPNNPTGTVLTKEQLKIWVDYARKNKALIVFDSAYEKYISTKNIPHSIYEIEGAKEVAIEIRSFSKTAGFTGIRCGYMVIPKEIEANVSKSNLDNENSNKIKLINLWKRRIGCKFNGVSYITQRAAESIYTKEGQKEIKNNINYYKNNIKIIKEGFTELGIENYGGIDSPYLWFKIANKKDSWELFDELLEKINIVVTPGVGFGINGKEYFRITGFEKEEEAYETIKRMKKFMNK